MDEQSCPKRIAFVLAILAAHNTKAQSSAMAASPSRSASENERMSRSAPIVPTGTGSIRSTPSNAVEAPLEMKASDVEAALAHFLRGYNDHVITAARERLSAPLSLLIRLTREEIEHLLSRNGGLPSGQAGLIALLLAKAIASSPANPFL